MSLWRQVIRGLRVLSNREAADRDIADEVHHYLDQAAAEFEARGLSPEDAHRAAQIELGTATIVREKVRSYGWENAVGTLFADLRYATRQLSNNPGFTLASVLTLALGIGATTAIFSAVYPILFEPLPYPHASQIAMIWYSGDEGSHQYQAFGTYRELAERNRSFESLAVFKAWQPTMSGPLQPERLEGQQVSARYFSVLGVSTAVGPGFQASDDIPNGPKVVILSERLRQRRFGGERTIVGRQIRLDDESYTVVGVLPRGFENVLAPTAEVWSLLQYDPSLPAQGREWGHHLGMVGRLRSDLGINGARRDLRAIAQTPRLEFPRQTGSSMRNGFIVTALQDDVTRGVRPALIAVIGAVILLLVIASANVTNLLLARGAQRRGELVMRVALGAGQWRVIRQLLTESLLLAGISGALGMAVTQAGVRTLVALSPPGLPRVNAIAVNGPVFMFALGISALVGLVVGLIPAWQASKEALHGEVQQNSRRTVGGRSVLRRALIVAEVAIALILLTSAGLLLRSMERLFAVAPGFDASHVLAMQVQTYGRRYDDDAVCHRFFAQTLEAVRQVPGVSVAAFSSELPLSGDIESKFNVYGLFVDSPTSVGAASGDVFRYAVTPDYFKAMGIPLRRGRLFDAHDMLAAPVRPVLINESLAKRVFADLNPIGQRVRFGGPSNRPWDMIVGVVGDVKQTSLAMGQSDAVYVTTAQWLWADGARWLVVRANGDVADLVPALKNAIWSVDKDQPIVAVATMNDLIAKSTAERRFVLILFEAFGLVALALAATGIYGVLSGSVNERTREIGVRSALGASRSDILALVVRQGITLTGLGIVIGLIGALAATEALVTLLYGVSRLDPVTYLGVVTLLAGVSLIACSAPAWHAARVDPAITLRAE